MTFPSGLDPEIDSVAQCSISESILKSKHSSSRFLLFCDVHNDPGMFASVSLTAIHT